MSLLDDVSIVVTPNGYKAGELYAVVPVPTEGTELVTNGDFATDSDWNKEVGWTISGGTANCVSAIGKSIFQTNKLIVGRQYKMTVTVTNFSLGYIGSFGNDFGGVVAEANGTYEIIGTATQTTFGFVAQGSFTGSIDNVSVKEYTAADMDVTRATAATRVDEAGLVNYAEILGSEEVTNGDFATDSDWGLGTGWTISGGSANSSGSNEDAYLSQSNMVIGKAYKVTFDVNSYTSGTLSVRVFGQSQVLGVTSTGSYSVLLTPSATTLLGFRSAGGSTGFIGSIDNVSVKEVTRDNVPRIDYTGGEDILGSEEVTNGDFATDLSGWTLSSSTPPVWDNGMMKMQSDGVTFSRADQSFVTEIGVKYKFKINKLVNGNNVQVKIGNGIGNSNVLNQTLSLVDEYTFTITPISTNTYIRIEDGSGSVGAYVSDISVKEITGQTTKASCPHILAEPQRTNLSNRNVSVWGASNSTKVLNDTTSPDGLNDGVKITATSVNQPRIERGASGGVPSTDTKYSFSAFVKKGNTPYIALSRFSGSQFTIFNLDAKSIVTSNTENATIEEISNGWFKISITQTVLATDVYNIWKINLTNGSNTNVGVVGDYMYVWGGQIEVGSYATSYIPTSGNTITRNQDIFTRDGIGSLINSTEGVLFVEMAALSNEALYREISLSDGTTNNVVEIRYTPTANQLQFVVRNASAVQVATSITLSNALDFNKIAFSFKSNDYKMYVNGSEVGTDLSGTMPSGLNTLSLDWAGNNNLFGKVKQLQVYKTALTDEQLLQLTGTSGTDFYESYAEMASALTYTIQ